MFFFYKDIRLRLDNINDNYISDVLDIVRWVISGIMLVVTLIMLMAKFLNSEILNNVLNTSVAYKNADKFYEYYTNMIYPAAIIIASFLIIEVGIKSLKYYNQLEDIKLEDINIRDLHLFTGKLQFLNPTIIIIASEINKIGEVLIEFLSNFFLKIINYFIANIVISLLILRRFMHFTMIIMGIMLLYFAAQKITMFLLVTSNPVKTLPFIVILIMGSIISVSISYIFTTSSRKLIFEHVIKKITISTFFILSIFSILIRPWLIIIGVSWGIISWIFYISFGILIALVIFFHLFLKRTVGDSGSDESDNAPPEPDNEIMPSIFVKPLFTIMFFISMVSLFFCGDNIYTTNYLSEKVRSLFSEFSQPEILIVNPKSTSQFKKKTAIVIEDVSQVSTTRQDTQQNEIVTLNEPEILELEELKSESDELKNNEDEKTEQDFEGEQSIDEEAITEKVEISEDANLKKINSSVETKIKLTIRSNVYNDVVYIDGKKYGSTRLEIELPKGKHTIHIEKEGYITCEKEINLEKARIIMCRLTETKPTKKPYKRKKKTNRDTGESFPPNFPDR